MIKIYTYDVRMMDGDAMIDSQTSVFTSMELAEKARRAVINENSKNRDVRFEYSDVTQRTCFETESEIPLLNRRKE